ncbi:glycoside hydrolase family 20 zincin-like fold domain-containing protein [Paenibacillus sp. sgz500958]|uniref:glycoside hydrolase family 20 zincin-like fold domain-containing protein n=1 Tax=Paenibacillus sp. sgz500958 TaxID=3242475 RepID=UPI0036D400F4
MTKSNPLLLVPYPQQLSLSPGFFRIPAGGSIIVASPEDSAAIPAARKLQQAMTSSLNLTLPLSIGLREKVAAACTMICDQGLPAQAYELTVTEREISVTYGSGESAFYAIATLKQILAQSGRDIPCLHIRDCPDFGARGLMLDISRNKIPKQETLYRVIDLMSDLKMNQLQLYIEGVPFAYESFPDVWALETPITGEEILLLDAYCRERFIDLVPNQNSFGHMEGWLTRPEFNALAEIPEGFMLPEGMYAPDFYPDGLFMRPGTFDTEDPAVLKLLEQMYDDLLPYFSSGQFNVGCDETYELGLGKSKDLAESLGKGSLYLSFLQKIHGLVKQRGKTMQFWGDIIIQYPELIPQLPKDIIAMEWGYSAEHPFEQDTLKFREAGIPFYVCPGTSSWNSLTGRSDNMIANLRSAAVHGKNNGAIGYLITDWGDFGHWQHLPVSYAGFVYGASLAWNAQADRLDDVPAYLNKFLFSDSSEVIGQLLLDLGNYYKLESGQSRPNDTEMSMLLRSSLDNVLLVEKLTDEHFGKLSSYIADIEARLKEVSLHCDDGELVLRELKSGIHFVKHAIKLGMIKRQLSLTPGNADTAELQAQIADLDILLHNYRLLWTERNRMGGLEQSVSKLLSLRQQYKDLLASCLTEANK